MLILELYGDTDIYEEKHWIQNRCIWRCLVSTNSQMFLAYGSKQNTVNRPTSFLGFFVATYKLQKQCFME